MCKPSWEVLSDYVRATCKRLSMFLRARVSNFQGWGGLTKSVRMKITHNACCCCAICQHSAINDIGRLRKHLRAGPMHYLGIHESYDPSWCSDVGNHQLKSANLPPNLMFEVEWAGDRMVSKAAQLIINNTINFSECYISIQAKMDGGINHSHTIWIICRLLYGLLLTLGPRSIETTWKHLFGTCSAVTITFVKQRKGSMKDTTRISLIKCKCQNIKVQYKSLTI